MKTDIHCPHCQSKNIHSPNKTTQVLMGITMAIIGVGFLVFALTGTVGYYLFALPLCTLGGIRAFKGYYSPVVESHCKDCQSQFEYMID